MELELNEIYSFLANKKNIMRLFKKYGSGYCEKLIFRLNESFEKIKEMERELANGEKIKQEKIKKVAEYMLSIGLKPNDFSNSKINKEKTIKYQYIDENNCKFEWSGRGKKPKWILELLKNGKDLNDLLINNK